MVYDTFMKKHYMWGNNLLCQSYQANTHRKDQA